MTLSQNHARCWILDYRSEDYENLHFRTEAEAREQIRSLVEDGDHSLAELEALHPLHLATAPCWMASALCDYVFDEDEIGPCHLDGPRDAAEKVLFASGWRLAASGDWLCTCGGICEEYAGPVIDPPPDERLQPPLFAAVTPPSEGTQKP